MNNEAIKKIAENNGFEKVSRQLMEECSKMTVEISEYRRAKWKMENAKGELEKQRYGYISCVKKGNVIEEIADVTIMLEQIKYLLSISDTDIDQIIEQKLNRQLERIGADE